MTLETRETSRAIIANDLVPGVRAVLDPLRKKGRVYDMIEEPHDDETTQVVLVGKPKQMDPAEEVLGVMSAQKHLPLSESKRIDVLIRIRDKVRGIIENIS